MASSIVVVETNSDAVVDDDANCSIGVVARMRIQRQNGNDHDIEYGRPCRRIMSTAAAADAHNPCEDGQDNYDTDN